MASCLANLKWKSSTDKILLTIYLMRGKGLQTWMIVSIMSHLLMLKPKLRMLK